MADAALKPEWRERFHFFERYGAPNSPEARAAFKVLPRSKMYLIYQNLFGLFFGPFYFLMLGMWKRALTLISIGVGSAFLVGVIQGVIPGRLSLVTLVLSLSLTSAAAGMVNMMIIALPLFLISDRNILTPDEITIGLKMAAMAMCCAILSATTVNYSYYLKQAMGDNGWNPFKGTLRWWEPLLLLLVAMVVGIQLKAGW